MLAQLCGDGTHLPILEFEITRKRPSQIVLINFLDVPTQKSFLKSSFKNIFLTTQNNRTVLKIFL